MTNKVAVLTLGIGSLVSAGYISAEETSKSGWLDAGQPERKKSWMDDCGCTNNMVPRISEFTNSTYNPRDPRSLDYRNSTNSECVGIEARIMSAAENTYKGFISQDITKVNMKYINETQARLDAEWKLYVANTDCVTFRNQSRIWHLYGAILNSIINELDRRMDENRKNRESRKEKLAI